MAKESILVAETRETSGSANARRVRRGGGLPGVVNNEKGEARSVLLNQHGFELMLHRHRSENLLLDLKVGAEEPKKVLLKAVQHDPLSGLAVHVDFLEISMTRRMRVHISVKLTGDPVGVTQEGGILAQALRSLDIECLPTDLVEQLEVDVSSLKIGQSILVRELKLDPKFTILSSGDLAVASVTKMLAEEAAPAAGEEVAAATAAEPEVIGEKERLAKKEAAEKAEKGEKKEKVEKKEKS
jgi:large subunit ribosomal protein L25